MVRAHHHTATKENPDTLPVLDLNVQFAANVEHHLPVAREVTDIGSYRAPMIGQQRSRRSELAHTCLPDMQPAKLVPPMVDARLGDTCYVIFFC